jgi:hypothetical protein
MPMPIYRYLERTAFTPEELGPIVSAYEDCLRRLNLTERPDAVKEIVAKKIIEIAQTGVRDPARMVELALADIRVPPA